jgi:hypothetical protein
MKQRWDGKKVFERWKLPGSKQKQINNALMNACEYYSTASHIRGSLGRWFRGSPTYSQHAFSCQDKVAQKSRTEEKKKLTFWRSRIPPGRSRKNIKRNEDKPGLP